MSVLNRSVLVLNKAWQAINIVPVHTAISQLAAGAVVALDFQGENQFVPTKWEDWIKLAPLSEDESIGTSHAQVRMPTVIICCEFNKLVRKKGKFTLGNIAKRDGRRCQYTGRELTRDRWSLDHVVPLSRGGSNTPDNVVLCDKDVNNKKGNKTPQEAGLPIPTIRRLPDFDQIEASHPHHELFLVR